MTDIPKMRVDIEYCYDKDEERWLYKISAGGYYAKVTPILDGNVPVIALGSALRRLSTEIKNNKPVEHREQDTGTFEYQGIVFFK